MHPSLFTEWENELPLERSCTMSPAVGNFVQDLVEMAKATETLPIVQHENENLKAYLSRAQDTIAARETAIISYKQQIDDLHAKVRSLEVERDDASFRVLEAEDTAHSILTQARNAQATLAEVIAKLDPPKPEPVKEPEPTPAQASWARAVSDATQPTDAPQGKSDTTPTEPSLTQIGGTGTGQSGQSESPSGPSIGGSESQAMSTSDEPKPDPEPTPKWSFDWYQWNDRRNERAKVDERKQAFGY